MDLVAEPPRSSLSTPQDIDLFLAQGENKKKTASESHDKQQPFFCKEFIKHVTF